MEFREFSLASKAQSEFAACPPSTIPGSFDKTCKVWDSKTGELLHTLKGHTTEIVCLSFNPQGDVIATGSMDNTAKLWSAETGEELCTLLGHTAEIVSLSFNQAGDKLITGSFDHTTKLWDVKSGRCIHTFQGHRGEISSCQVIVLILAQPTIDGGMQPFAQDVPLDGQT